MSMIAPVIRGWLGPTQTAETRRAAEAHCKNDDRIAAQLEKLPHKLREPYAIRSKS